MFLLPELLLEFDQILGYGRICSEALSPIERLLGQLRFAAIPMKQAQSEMSQSAARLDLRRALERFQRLLVLFRELLRAAEAKQGFSLKGIESN